MRSKIIVMLLLFIFSLSPHARVDWSKPAEFLFNYAVGKVMDFVWDKATDKPDMKELQDRLSLLERKIPEYRPSIQEIISKVDSSTSREDFKKIVYDETNELEKKIRNNEIHIKNIEAKIDSINSQLSEHTMDLFKIKKELGIQDQSYTEFLSSYYNSVMTDPLIETYSKLSRNYQTKISFDTYSAWWGRTVSDFTIDNAKKIDDNTYLLNINYVLQNGQVKCSRDLVYVTKQGNKMLIDDVISKTCY
ncbi:MAG: hypothetical protein ACWA5U_01710 [bacterium]